MTSRNSLVAGLMLALVAALPAQAETGRLTVELNKAEEIEGGGCRAFSCSATRPARA